MSSVDVTGREFFDANFKKQRLRLGKWEVMEYVAALCFLFFMLSQQRIFQFLTLFAIRHCHALGKFTNSPKEGLTFSNRNCAACI